MPTVEIRSPDWEATFARLAVWHGAVREKEPGLCGILLFGSLARGDYAPGSDADLLVVVEASPYPPRERPRHLLAAQLPVCADIVVYTAEEFHRFLDQGNPFLRRALSEGRWLYRRAGWEVPQS